MSEFNSPTSPEQALALLLRQITPLGAETVPLPEALGRVNYRDIYVTVDQPPCDRSLLDGYALRTEDLASGLTLRVAQTLFAGDSPAQALGPGQAARVMTGAQLPPHTGLVIGQEDTRREDDTLHILAEPAPGKNIARRGEALRRGDKLAERGEELGSAHLGLLAGQGLTEVEVFRQPRLGLLATGSELTPPGQELAPGKIYDSNSPLLAARLQLLGAVAVLHASVADDSQDIGRALAELLAETDLVITTGGVSVGERDLLPQAAAWLGAQTLFHRLPYRPGGGVLALQKEGKLLLCLSGNPFAALASCELLAVPCLRKLAGASDHLPLYRSGVLQQEFAKPSPLRRFIRARLTEGLVFLDSAPHGWGGNCLIDVPAGSPALRQGETVQVLILAGGSLR